MTKSAKLLATLLLAAAVAACGKTETPASTTGTVPTAPATTTEATQAPAEPAPAAEAAVDPAVDAAANQAVAAAAADTTPLVEGVDYTVISGGQPYSPVAGKIEVAEVFGYVCPACAAFQPLVSAWKKQLPADVNFVYVPAPFGGTWDNYARAYFAAESLGLVERTHDAMYRAIHVENRLRGERGQDSVESISAFYQQQAGADPKTFVDAMNSFAMGGRVNRAKQFIQRSGVSGTPSLVVEGKYLVVGKSRDDQLRIANQLIARERAAR